LYPLPYMIGCNMAHCTLGLDSMSWLESQLTVNAGKVLAF